MPFWNYNYCSPAVANELHEINAWPSAWWIWCRGSYRKYSGPYARNCDAILKINSRSWYVISRPSFTRVSSISPTWLKVVFLVRPMFRISFLEFYMRRPSGVAGFTRLSILKILRVLWSALLHKLPFSGPFRWSACIFWSCIFDHFHCSVCLYLCSELHIFQ